MWSKSGPTEEGGWGLGLAFCMVSCAPAAPHFCPGGEIGRHRGLKIPRPLRPCRFKSGPGHHLNYSLMFASVLRLDILALPSGNFLVTEPFGTFFLPECRRQHDSSITSHPDPLNAH